MTVTSEVSQLEAPGNGTATQFSFSPMIIFAPGHLVVERVDASDNVTLLVLGVDYTINIGPDGYPGTGAVLYPMTGSPLPAGEKLRMTRDTPVVQLTELENQGPYQAEVQEGTFDYSRVIDQEHDRRIEDLEITVSGLDRIPVEGEIDADQVKFDNTGTDYTGDNVQDALVETDTRLKGKLSAISGTGAATGLVADPNSSGVGILKDLEAGTNVSFVADGSKIRIDAATTGQGEANTASNAGSTGEGLALAKVGVDLPFKRLEAGAGVTFDSLSDRIRINAPGGGLPWFNVRDYGAVGDGTTDDLAAFIAARDALQTAGGGVFYVPATSVRYRVGGTVAFQDVDLAVVGDGKENSTVAFDLGSGIDGFTFKDSTGGGGGNARKTIGFRHLSITAINAGQGRAIFADWSDTGVGASLYSFSMLGVNVRPDEYFSSGNPQSWWNIGVELRDCSASHIDMSQIKGRSGQSDGEAAVLYTRDNFTNAQNHRITSFYLEKFDAGVKVRNDQGSPGSMEGYYVANGEIVGCDRSVVLENTGSAGNRIGTVLITNVHMNARSNCILGSGGQVSGVRVTGCEMRLQNNGAAAGAPNNGYVPNATVIDITNGGSVNVAGCGLIGHNSASGLNSNGVNFVSFVLDATVTGNDFSDMTNGITVANQLNGTKIATTGNQFVNLSGSRVVDDMNSGGYHDNGFRGALVYRNNDAGMGSPSLISWEALAYDTDSLWDGSQRFTIPANTGIRRVRLVANLAGNSFNGTGKVTCVIQKNGSGTYPGAGRGQMVGLGSGDGGNISLSTPVLLVNPGDYFDVLVSTSIGGNVSGGQRSSFGIEVID